MQYSLRSQEGMEEIFRERGDVQPGHPAAQVRLSAVSDMATKTRTSREMQAYTFIRARLKKGAANDIQCHCAFKRGSYASSVHVQSAMGLLCNGVEEFEWN